MLYVGICHKLEELFTVKEILIDKKCVCIYYMQKRQMKGVSVLFLVILQISIKVLNS